jgi:hypothetical protein
MELLDRYLQAVKKHLPLKRQDDIIAELRANMESQIEDKESKLGRPLDTKELEDLLRKMGPPILVAGRYQPQQYLIGPAVFPIYWYVLRIAFLWATIIYAIVNAVVIPLSNANGPSVMEGVLRYPGVLMNVGLWVTLVFAAIEFAAAHYPDKCSPIAGISSGWSPSTLPPLDPENAPRKKGRSYAQAIAEVVFGFLFLVWLLLVPRHPFLALGPGALYLKASPFKLGPMWMTFFWWIVGLNVLQLVLRLVDLIRDTWQQSSSMQHIAVKLFSLIPIGLLLFIQDRAYVVLKNPALDGAHYAHTVDTINNAIHLGLMVVCSIAVLQLIFDLGQLAMKSYSKRVAAR